MIRNQQDYTNMVYSILNSEKRLRKSSRLEKYIHKQFDRFNELIESISGETFLQVFPEILGIDAKFTLVIELLKYEEFSDKEIIRITGNDYATYFKELCGYNLKMETKHSIAFNVL